MAETRKVKPQTIALDKLDIVYVPIDDLKPNSYNPNRQTEADFELLLKSITDDGFTQPVIAIRRSKEIVDGEHRWRAAQALGMDKVPTVFVDMTPEQQRIATLRHNRARGSEDMQLAAQLLRDLTERGVAEGAIEALGLSEDELDFLVQDIPEPEVLTAPEVVAAKAADPNDHAAIADATRAAEQRIAVQKVEESTATVARERSIFRLNLSFTGDEIGLVKRVLGSSPAARVLEMCRDEIVATAN